ncbi:unnamed protein product [Allacma fusca]|uniref:Uncharacterized protein n=1 Tax=Allacma fusca TaxID=39272 RepID=A0A8J2J2Y8_9HEXA|nr:unnamed protein product [Allacma fusca]
MFGKIKSASRIKHFIEISLVTSFVLVIWLILNFIVFRSRISNDFKVQTEGFKDQDINSTFSSNKDGIRKDPRNAQTFQVRPVGPSSREKVRRILWWSTVYGGSSGFFAVGDGKDLVSLATKCKCKCEFTVDKTQLESSHGVIFHGWGDDLPVET